MSITPAFARSQSSFCVTETELQDILLVAAPGALAAMEEGCAAVLPHGLVLGNPESALSRSVEGAARDAWPRANKMFIRALLSEKGAAGASNGDLTYEEVRAGIRPMIGKIAMDKETCGSADRILKLMEPLPVKNFAGIIVEIAHIATKGDKKKFICE